MNDPSLVVHKCCILLVKTGGIIPHSKMSGLCSYGSIISAGTNDYGRDMLFCSFLIALEPAGMLVTNGDGVSGISEVGGER